MIPKSGVRVRREPGSGISTGWGSLAAPRVQAAAAEGFEHEGLLRALCPGHRGAELAGD